jgi:hypothetical protein
MLGIDDPRTKIVHEAPKGGKFRIVAFGSLFGIEMENGGVRPAICNQKYTTHKKAKDALEMYFRNNPKPVPRDEAKSKV